MKKWSRGNKWVLAVWSINALCVVLVSVGLVVFWDKTPFASAQSIPTRMVMATLPPTLTLTPSLAKLPQTATPSESLPVTPDDTPTFTDTSSPTIRPSITPYLYITDTPTQQPWFAGPVTLGYSVEGRPLELYRFGTGSINRMIVAGIHGGGEWNTVALADELIAYLREHREKVPENVTLYILRNLNPDGDARAHAPEGRVNAHGVDLNRNFPTNWQAEWDRDGCWNLLPTTGGDYAGSEPETVALMIFIQQHNIDALISYHSAALGIFAGGIPPDRASIRLAEALAAVSDYPYPPLDTGCLYTGNLVDWASSKDIAAVDVELTNHSDTDFEINLDILRVFLKWKR